MNAKTASIAAGVAGTLLFGAFLTHNYSFDIQRKKAPVAFAESTNESYANTKNNASSVAIQHSSSKKSAPVLVASQVAPDTQAQQPAAPPATATNKKIAKTRAS